MRYSVILPAHNEAENLRALLPEVAAAMDLLLGPYEVLVVDDGSTDGTAAIVEALHDEFPEVRVLRLNGRCGQSAALEAGFRAARGDVLVTLDADGQNPPAEIPRLVAALQEEGCGLVCGRRTNRQDCWVKRAASRIANGLRRAVLQDGTRDTGCSLKAFRREAVARIKLFHGLHRFLPALVQMEGFRVLEIRVAHRARTHGTSHYGVCNRLLGPLLDLLAVWWMQRRCRRWRVCQERVRQGLVRSPAPASIEVPSVAGAPPASP